MRSTVGRIALLLLLITTVAVRLQALRSRDAMMASFDIDFAIKAVIEEYGIPPKENPVKSPSILSSAVYFQQPDCSEPSIILPFSLNYEALPLLARIVPMQSYSYTFIYLDGRWSTQNRILMFVEWFRQAALALANATRYLPVKTAVVLAEPKECQASAHIDWRSIWDKRSNRVRIEKKAPYLIGVEDSARRSHAL